jgi:hypothetical protein
MRKTGGSITIAPHEPNPTAGQVTWLKFSVSQQKIGKIDVYRISSENTANHKSTTQVKLTDGMTDVIISGHAIDSVPMILSSCKSNPDS